MAKTLQGVVSSDRGDKTIVVTVANRITHPIYKKQYTVSRKFMAHDENNEAKIGDKVVIAESRPLSARKRFILLNILEKAAIRHDEPESTVPSPKSKVENPRLATKDKGHEATSQKEKS